MTQFENPILKQALEKMRAEQNQTTLLKASQALLDTKVMAPAKWDIEPTRKEDGSLTFSPDTKISLMVVAGQDGTKFFPMFTGMEEVKNFYGDQKVNCLVLSMDQYLPFLKAAEKEVAGIVVDPAGVNVPFQSGFLEGIHNAYKKPLNQNTIQKGDRVLLKNPEADQNLEAALISAGFHEPAVKAIYLKERLEDENDPEKTHWFIVVDSDELDTGIFSRIGEILRPVCKGKEMEFLFTNQKLGADIARTSKPLYVKAA